ncbi:acyl-CoA dehydrogenase family protein [Microbacterium sp. SORGH_AS_0862]|uniref:acyl-CoA dehydrogenase family protein n=1 Tax=Microbacterium sp. SORGH_AS_0862 TaxID=3041789 RepID=UPI00278CAFCC|nr:acyl-CoA dehydrogenase family protein [Microbacterium sp. SORGH_AS_0862]MDQ1204310.1 alkylation response protein AidB-like acyl-CoA dehydrogenase [Microbacterium sp. SORGH_AS_0862]
MSTASVAAEVRTHIDDQLWARLPVEIEARFRPIVDVVAEGAGERDLTRELPRDAVAWLREAGLGRARLALADGGLGLDCPTFTRLLVAIAAADANIPQILRGHVALVEQALTTTDAAFARRWIDRIAAGEISGNSWSEATGSTTSRAGAELSTDADGILRLNGRKFYTTGSIFAEWTDTVAHRLSDGVDVAALVRLDQPGVTVIDDWDGFGQRLTGTGTIVFEDAVVDPADVLPVAERFAYQTGLYQLVLLAVLAGIAHASVADAAAAVRARSRVYSHGTAARVQDDAQIQALLGELAASAFAVDASVAAVAEAVEDAYGAALAARDRPDDEAAIDRARRLAGLAEIRAAQAQSFATGAVQQLTSRLFDTLGASATARGAHLDRHWRNARTVSSHNPVLYKNRWVGEWVLHDRLPQALWAVGTPSPAK